MIGYSLTAGPAVEPITLAEAKTHCRIDFDDDDSRITALIVAARSLAEEITSRVLITQQWVMYLDAFPAHDIAICKPPLVSVQSVKYLDFDSQKTLDAGLYSVAKHGQVGRIAPAYGCCWPVTRPHAEAVEIAFTAGYGGAADVPKSIKQWMLMCIATWYDNNASVTESASLKEMPRGAWDGLLDAYRVTRFS